MVDQLLPLKNSYYTGGYQKLYTSVNSVPPQQAVQAKSILLRALLAERNYAAVLQQISASDPVEIQALRLLATYYKSQPHSEGVLEEMEGFVDLHGNSEDVLVTAATMYAAQGMLEKALYLLINLPKNMEA